jgi:uncharacterized protein YdiU (UPF0061 family)
MDALADRIEALEERISGFRLGNGTESLNNVVQNLRLVIQKQTLIETLIQSLEKCNVDYNETKTHTDCIEDKKEVVLAAHDQFVQCFEQLEYVLSEYSGIFDNFAIKCQQLETVNIFNKAAVLQRYKIIVEKFTNIVQRLVKLLELSALNKYKQNKVLESINSITT